MIAAALCALSLAYGPLHDLFALPAKRGDAEVFFSVGFGHGAAQTEAMAETALEMAQRHVREGAARVERQRTLVDTLTADGHEALAEEAKALLAVFEDVQVKYVRDAQRLMAKK